MDDSWETVLWKGAYTGACTLVEVVGGDEEGSWSVHTCVVRKVDQMSGGGSATQKCWERRGVPGAIVCMCICMCICICIVYVFV